MGLESSWLKSPGLKGLGLKLCFEKSEVEMSFNHDNGIQKLARFNCPSGFFQKTCSALW